MITEDIFLLMTVLENWPRATAWLCIVTTWG